MTSLFLSILYPIILFTLSILDIHITSYPSSILWCYHLHSPNYIFIWLLIYPLSYNTLHTLHIRSSYDVLSLLNPITLSSHSSHYIFIWRLISPQSNNIFITLFTLDIHMKYYLSSILWYYHHTLHIRSSYDVLSLLNPITLSSHSLHWIFKWLLIYCLSYNFTHTLHTNR